MLCAISVVLQTYALSINSQHVLLVSSPRQRACETIGISAIESIYRPDNVFRSCNTDKFVPFIPEQTYALERDQKIILMYGSWEDDQIGASAQTSPHGNVNTTPRMRFASCHVLGVSCFRWRIQVRGFGARRFEPCWSLVRNMYTTNASHVVMVHRIQVTSTNQPTFALNMSIPREPGDARKSRFLFMNSHVKIPIHLVDTHVRNTKELDAVSHAPDSSTFFVVLPSAPGQHSTMQLAMSTRCDTPESEMSRSAPFFHSGVIHLAAAATPTVYTIYAAFSECSQGSGGCNSRLLTSFAVYIANIALCISCLLLTHGCAPLTPHEYSVVYIFAFATAVVTFNWVAFVCIYFSHPASMHGGLLNLNRVAQLGLYILHGVQLLVLIVEIVRNQLGSDHQYVLSRMHRQFSPDQLLLPFTLLDSNIYIENCAIYICSNCFIAYLLYFKCAA